jgi:hypothetical protein
MTLSDPRPALGEHSSLVDYLCGVVALARLIDELAHDTSSEHGGVADDFVHLLLGVASLGAAIDGLADAPPNRQRRHVETAPQRWLR